MRVNADYIATLSMQYTYLLILIHILVYGWVMPTTNHYDGIHCYVWHTVAPFLAQAC